jgi:hypothetical protein
MTTVLPGIRASFFDAYGPLCDYLSVAAGCRDPLGDGLVPLTTLWREKQLQYTGRAPQGRCSDFWQGASGS